MSSWCTVAVFCFFFPLNSDSITFTVNATNKSGPALPAEYLSVTMGAITDENAHNFPFDSEELNILAKGISPSFMRVGGIDNDQIQYLMEGNVTYSLSTVNTTYTMNLTLFSKIGDFAKRNNWKFVFGLNEQTRTTSNNQWNSTNSLELLNAIKNSNKQNNHNPYVFALELGNEPNDYDDDKDKSNGYIVVKPDQEAIDFNVLYNLIQDTFNTSSNINYFVPQIWGNDVTSRSIETYLEEWEQSIFSMDNTKQIDAMTFHHYYGSGAVFNLSDYISVKNLDSLISVLQNVTSVSYKYFGKNKPIIMGETAASSGGGAANITDTFIDGFMWLDKLGLSSIYGIYAICRQKFHGGKYALINSNKNGNLIITPDYWSSYLFKNLVGNKVIYVENEFDHGRYLRMYAFCTRTPEEGSIFDYKLGSITIMMLNLYNQTQIFDINIIGINNGNNISYDEFHLTPKDGIINSPDILLNGQIIKMINSTTFPKLIPINSKFDSNIQIEALSYCFIVVVNADSDTCIN